MSSLYMQSPRHPKMADTTEVRASEPVLAFLRNVKLDGIRHALFKLEIDSEITELEPMGSIDTLDLQREECSQLHMQILWRELEMFCSHLNSLVWDSALVEVGWDRFELLRGRASEEKSCHQ